MASPSDVDPTQRALVQRALAGGEFGLLPLRFRASVIDRYREQPNAVLIRTRSIGRIAVARGWSLDVGIVPGEEEVEVFAKELAERLPEGERQHWLDHLVTTPSSKNYATTRLTAAACIDDGEPEAW